MQTKNFFAVLAYMCHLKNFYGFTGVITLTTALKLERFLFYLRVLTVVVGSYCYPTWSINAK